MALSTSHALRRLGLGGAPGEAATVAADPYGWLWRQTTHAPKAPDPEPLRRTMRAFQATTRAPTQKARQAAMRAYFRDIRPKLRQSLDTSFVQGAQSDIPFVERMVWFWTNHFTVSAKGKARVLPFIGSYVDDAIRPHALGKFGDMLVAVAQHPAMLIYLDNTISMAQIPGPVSGTAET